MASVSASDMPIVNHTAVYVLYTPRVCACPGESDMSPLPVGGIGVFLVVWHR